MNEKIYRVNAGENKSLRTDILKPLINTLAAMQQKYCRVHVMRFDLHMPDFTETNKIMSLLQRRLFRRIRAKYKTKDIGFVWVRELERAKPQHYHCVIYIDGNKIRHSGLIQNWVAEIWDQIGGASYHWVKSKRNIDRGDEEALQEMIYHISYLAKPRGKGYRPTQTKDYGWARNICTSVRSISNVKKAT
jgi:hypothetical protein